MFHMSNDSGLFRTRDELEADGWHLEGNVFVRDGKRMLPLYEAKMIHHFDHQWATYERDGTVRDVTPEEKADPTFHVMPRYWVTEVEVDARLGAWPHDWLLGWRDICRTTDARTCIASRLPRFAMGDPVLLAFPALEQTSATLLEALWCSFVFDYVVRQKVGGMHLKFHYFRQIATAPPASFSEPWGDHLQAALPPTGSRDRAEIDAIMFRVYGIDRGDVDYILDTFPIVRRKDEAKFGEYRTKRLILEAYDRLGATEREVATA
jgi:hypothetical protein